MLGTIWYVKPEDFEAELEIYVECRGPDSAKEQVPVIFFRKNFNVVSSTLPDGPVSKTKQK